MEQGALPRLYEQPISAVPHLLLTQAELLPRVPVRDILQARCPGFIHLFFPYCLSSDRQDLSRQMQILLILHRILNQLLLKGGDIVIIITSTV